MEKIKEIRIKNEDGSLSDILTIAPDANVVGTANGSCVQDELDRLSSSESNNEIALNNLQSQLSNEITARKNGDNHLQNQVDSLASGSPKGTYETATALKNANPETGVYIITSDGHVYGWVKNKNGDPIDLGKYQSTGLADDSVNVNHIGNLMIKDSSKNKCVIDSFKILTNNAKATVTFDERTGYFTINKPETSTDDLRIQVNLKNDINAVGTIYKYLSVIGSIQGFAVIRFFDSSNNYYVGKSNLQNEMIESVQTISQAQEKTSKYCLITVQYNATCTNVKFGFMLSDEKLNQFEYCQKFIDENYIKDKSISTKKIKDLSTENIYISNEFNIDISNYKKWNADSVVKVLENGILNYSTPAATSSRYAGIYWTKQFEKNKKINISIKYEVFGGKGTLDIKNGTDVFGPLLGRVIIDGADSEIKEVKFENLLLTASDQLTFDIIGQDSNFSINILDFKCGIVNTDLIYKPLNEYFNFINESIKNIDISNLETENYNQRIIDEQLKNDFKWSSDISNERYAVFTFDDARSDIDIIENLFESKNVPCCYAVIPSRLTSITTNGETVKQVLDRAVQHGGEVLSHWGSPLTQNSSDKEYKDVYIGAKQTLENNGYKVNGIITAGGTDYDTQDYAKDTLLARIYYQYADLTAGNNHDIEQFYNRRNFLDPGVASIKSLIDNYISKTGTQPYSKWLNFASHGTSDTSIADIEEIIDYCISNNIQIVTWKFLYDNFKSSKLEERIKNLEK